MESFIVVPYNNVFEVLSVITGFDPDIVSRFLKAFPPLDGVSYGMSTRNVRLPVPDDELLPLLEVVSKCLESDYLSLYPPNLTTEYACGVHVPDELVDMLPEDVARKFRQLNQHTSPVIGGLEPSDGFFIYFDYSLLLLKPQNLDENGGLIDPTMEELLSVLFMDVVSLMLENWEPSLRADH